MSASRFWILFLIFALSQFAVQFVSPCAFAEDGLTSTFPSSRDSYDLGLQSGIILSKGITGIDEIIPGWGFRLAQPIGRGAAEIETFLGQGHGISYDSLAVDYRLDLPAIDELVALVHIGLHFDVYKGADEPWATGFGFQLGGGIMQPIAGPVAFRADFQYRSAPGSSLELIFGLIFRQSSGGGGS